MNFFIIFLRRGKGKYENCFKDILGTGNYLFKHSNMYVKLLYFYYCDFRTKMF